MSDADTSLFDRPARPPDRTEITGPASTDVYDVYEPDPGRARHLTVALVHGGFWRERYDRAHLGPLAGALARDGFHVANLEYPRTGMPGGGWPGTARSVLARLESVHADTGLPDRVVLVGHSAGGYLALWAASADRAPWLTGVLALAPVADLATADRLGLGDGAIREFLGGAPDGAPQVWAAADIARQRLTTRTVLVIGDADDVIPAEVSDAYTASRTPAEPFTSSVARDADHADLVDPVSRAYLLLLAEVEELTLRPH
ncbi:MAG: alpha/beta hydrolase family protein [Dermatophilaceae bacterium]